MKKKELNKIMKDGLSLLKEAKQEILNLRTENNRLKMLFYQDYILINDLQYEYDISDKKVVKLLQQIQQVKV